MWITGVIVVLIASKCLASCPPKCTCYLDTRGRRSVQCKEGGIVGPLVLNISETTEVLKISAPEDNMNQLTMSPVFYDYRNLEEIHITRSNIPQLGMHFFHRLTKLDVLDLSQNNITQPLDHNFRGLTHLKELYLDDNRINSLPSGTFRYLQELKVLSIQRNRISELMPRIFVEIGKLRVLRMSGNDLKQLSPVVFQDIQELRSLECRSCGLTKIDKQVYDLLSHLEHLDLGDNELTSIAGDEYKPLTALRHLKLDGNRITAIKSSVFFNQPELRTLNLARNSITRISKDAFDNLHNLTNLDVSYNRLEDTPPDFLETVGVSLHVLTLSGNHLSHRYLKKLLNKLTITELNMAECGIVDFPFSVIPDSVTILNLADNHLISLSSDVVPANLQEVDLSGNRFRGLDEDLLHKLDDARLIKLERNPWSCDLCHIIPLLERANRSADFKEIRCHQPYSAKGKKLSMLTRSELTWCTIPSYTSGDANFFLLGDDGRIGLIAAGSSVCLLFLVVLAVLAALLYSRRHAAKYYTHEDKLAPMEGEVFDSNHSPLFCEDRELSFKFPLDAGGEKKLSVCTIDEMKKEHAITNGAS